MISLADIERKMGVLAKDKEMQEAYKQKKMRFYLSAKLYLETEPSLEYLIAKARELQAKKDAAEFALNAVGNPFNLEEIKQNHRLTVISDQLKLIKFLLD